MWFVELENVGEASWAICREQGREDPGPRTQDRYILMGKYEEEKKKKGIQSPLNLGIRTSARISVLCGVVFCFQ